MLDSAVEDLYGIFMGYAPHPLPEGGYGLKRWQGFSGRTIKYCIRDAINGNLGKPRYRLIEYRLGNEKNSLFTVSDLLRFKDMIKGGEDIQGQPYLHESNIVGLLAERMAWHDTHYWLSRFSPQGQIVRDSYEEDHLFANSGKFVLKIKNSPNMVLLQQSRHSPDGYVCIKELDGLFLYESKDESYVIVQETKVNSLNIGLDYLMYDLFNPLREVFPGSRIIYLVYSDMKSIYAGGNNMDDRKKNMNRIAKEPMRIYETLLNEGIPTMFFGFRESGRPFEDMKRHLTKHYDLLQNRSISLSASVSHGDITIWFGDTPLLMLSRNHDNHALWQEKNMNSR